MFTMASTFQIEILTPERSFYSGKIEMVILNTPDGEMGILANHAPTVAAVSTGEIKIKKDNDWLSAIISEGFMEITSEKTVILTDTAEWPNEIDANRAEEARKRAEERLMRQTNNEEYIRSKATLAKALARLKVSKNYTNKP
jgi:F-type H+-transporting ATPase subunit epsilon